VKFNNRYSVSPAAKIGQNVKIGDNAVIYDNVDIGDNSIICNDCVIGEPLNDYYSNPEYKNPVLKIGANSLIRSHSIIYAGSVFGDHFQTGHRVTIRENMIMGNHCLVGTLSDIQGFSAFGDYCRLHSNVHIGQQSKIGNFVFIYPFVVLTNDPHPPSNICKGPAIGDFTQIAVHSIILPGVKIGENCLIAANSVVGRLFPMPKNVVIAGSPAKVISKIEDIESHEHPGESHYPWMNHFSRGMPWKGTSYNNWLYYGRNCKH
jgi:UDP-3-O-[3-hydroxymyristoyl] glucosamine N-acyltransferase